MDAVYERLEPVNPGVRDGVPDIEALPEQELN
jgi:hypothetical protein